jgi:hypothetical protein
MVHAWMSEKFGDMEQGYAGHGPKFAAECNRIGAVLGFPEVAPKGRGGKARAETWPELPPGDDEGEETRTPKPKKERAPRGDAGDAGDAGDPAALERARILAYLGAVAAALETKGEAFDLGAKAIRWVGEEIERGAHLGAPAG